MEGGDLVADNIRTSEGIADIARLYKILSELFHMYH